MGKNITTKFSILKSIFTNLANPSAYSNYKNVYNEAKKINKNVTSKQVLNELQSSNTYTLHKQKRIRFPRLKTIPLGYLTDLQADLAVFKDFAMFNNGYKYLLVCVDVLSRMLFVAPIKSKSPRHVKWAFDKIFEKMPFEPKHIFTDKGMEFEAKEMYNYYKDKNILKYVAQSPDVKAAIAERFIKTVKNRLYRYFTENKTLRWLEPIELIEQGINNSYNRSIGMCPAEVNIYNANELWDKLYLNNNRRMKRYKRRKARFQVGDQVRISKHKGTFEKGYLPNYTQEVFKIDKVKTKGLPNYRIVDLGGEKIIGKFYEQEFSKTKFKK